MRLGNTRETYGLVHQILHWSVALGIIAMIALGVFMERLPDGTADEVARKVWLYSLHKTVGIALLVLALLRIAWAAAQPHPNLLHGGWEALAAKTVHWLLYALIVAMPVFGWLHHAALAGYAPIWWPAVGGFDWGSLPFVPKSPAVAHFFGTAHWVTGYAIAGLLLLHVGGALKHALVDRDRTLARMVPGLYRETGFAPAPKGYTGASLAAAGLAVLAGAGVIAGVYLLDAPERGGAATVAVAAAPAGEGAWTIDRERSRLAIEVSQLGSPVEGAFNEWSANVVFDPQRPEEARIRAEVAIASLALSDVSERATSAEFLDAAAHPVATFVSDEVVRVGEGFETRGRLTLAGVERPLTIAFTFEEREGRAFVQGEAVLQRLDFGVGEGFADDSSVGRAVKVLLSIEAEPADAAAG